MEGKLLKLTLPFFVIWYFPLFLFYAVSKNKSAIVSDARRWVEHQPNLFAGYHSAFMLIVAVSVLKPEFRKQLIWRIGGGKSFILNWLYGSCSSLYIERPTVIGDGLMVIHGAGTVIGGGSRIGRNLTIYQNATIGFNNGFPTIGDNVFIGAGAVVIGKIKVGNNVKIGAGAIVVEDVPDNSTVVGPKAKIIQKNA